nr:hypothetical protein [Allomuricauda sp.]
MMCNNSLCSFLACTAMAMVMPRNNNNIIAIAEDSILVFMACVKIDKSFDSVMKGAMTTSNVATICISKTPLSTIFPFVAFSV